MDGLTMMTDREALRSDARQLAAIYGANADNAETTRGVSAVARDYLIALDELDSLKKESAPMGYSARQNAIARQASSGKLHSRATIIGAMDHALELHASALRLLEAKIVALNERIARIEKNRSRCTICGEFPPAKAWSHVHPTPEPDGAYWIQIPRTADQMPIGLHKPGEVPKYGNAD